MSEGARRSDGSIDWPLIRARMEQAEAALSEALNPSPLRAKEIMDARAHVLARVPAPPRPPGSRVDMIEFRLGKERYAIETHFVHEVVRFVDYTPVPAAAESVIGVTNFRGTMLAVVDLCRLFHIPRQGLTDQSRLIVLGKKSVEFGILADEMRGQIELSVESILTDSSTVSEMTRAYLRGITPEALIVLDGSALLSNGDAIVSENKNSSNTA